MSIGIIKTLYTISLGIFEIIYEIVVKLDCDTRTNIYIGVTGIMIAIVIFVAELVSSNKIEVHKKFILEKTRIVNNIKMMIIVMAIIWFAELVKDNFLIGLYIIVQLIIDLMIMKSMLETFKSFYEVIKLNANKEYFQKQLKQYIFSTVEKYMKERKITELELKEKHEEFEEFIRKSKIYENKIKGDFVEEGYKAFGSNKSGYIKSYNYSVLDKIQKSIGIHVKKINDGKVLPEDISGLKPKIYICRDIGEKCEDGMPIAYYKDIKKELINMIDTAIEIETKEHIDYDKEIEYMINDLFEIARQNLLGFDNENLLLEFYDYICKNNYNNIIITFITKVNYTVREIANNIDKNIEFSRFLTRIEKINLRNNQYENFKEIDSCITLLYIERTKYEKANLKYIAYDYVLRVLIPNKNLTKRKMEYKYYDIVMANLLRLIKEYMRQDNIEPILILFNNIYFDKNRDYYVKEFDDYDIVEFQFVISIIYFILYLNKRNSEIDKKKREVLLNRIDELIKVIKHKMFKLNNAWDIILNYVKHYDEKTEVYNIIETMDFDSESHKYKISWSWIPINRYEALKSMIYMFGIRFINIKDINESDIKMEDKYEYENILKVFKASSFVELEQKYNYEVKYKGKIIELISIAIRIADRKQKQFERKADLSKEKIEKFKKVIIENINFKSEIEKIIYDLHKVKKTTKIINNVSGISQLIPRDWFIDNNYETVIIDEIAEEYGKEFGINIEDEIIEHIKRSCKKTNETLEEKIVKLKDLENYILLANSSKMYALKNNLDNDNRNLKVNGKKIEVIFTFDVEDFIIINKQALPNIKLGKFDETFNNNKIIGDGIYIEIADCAKNKKIRDKLIENNEWLKERGDNNAQQDYLKLMCDLEVFKAYEIEESDLKDGYIIKNNKN